MKTVTIYMKDKADPINDAVYLDEGFSWWAFIFNIFWLLYNRLWLHTFAFSIISIAIMEMHQAMIIDSLIATIAFFALWIYIGFNGKDYLRYKMESEGFKLADILVVNNIEEAEYRFISKFLKV